MQGSETVQNEENPSEMPNEYEYSNQIELQVIEPADYDTYIEYERNSNKIQNEYM